MLSAVVGCQRCVTLSALLQEVEQYRFISSDCHNPKKAKTENRKEKRTNVVTRRRVLLQYNELLTRKQVDDDLEVKLGMSVGGDREPPREHIVWVVFGFQTL